jgi:hypothetical protein
MDTERDGLTELESDIRATADSVAADAARLQAIEEAKAALPVGDPRLAELSLEAETLGAKVARKTRVESALVREAQPDGDLATGRG